MQKIKRNDKKIELLWFTIQQCSSS